MASWIEHGPALAGSPAFAVPVTVVAYVLANRVYERCGRASMANPVLWSVAALAGVFLWSGTPYPLYFTGAQPIHFLLGPAVVALAWPLWERLHELRQRAWAITGSALAGGLAGALSAVLIGWALGLPPEVLRSLAPKSVTAAAAISISEQIGGIANLTTLFTLLTGLIGALTAKPLFDALGVAAMPVRGFAMGTAAHGLGSARALQVDPDCGAYAVLALLMQVVLASVLLPWLVPPLMRWLLG